MRKYFFNNRYKKISILPKLKFSHRKKQWCINIVKSHEKKKKTIFLSELKISLRAFSKRNFLIGLKIWRLIFFLTRYGLAPISQFEIEYYVPEDI